MEHTHVVMQLLFENTQFTSMVNSTATSQIFTQNNRLSMLIRSEIFFELFPFHVAFKRNLEIVSIGESLKQVMKNVENENLTDVFNLVRPIMTFNWQNVSNFIRKVISDIECQFLLAFRLSVIQTMYLN
jgi:hypothetical protein